MAEIGFAPLPFKEAIEAFQRRARNLDPSFSWLDRWGLEHGRMFTVAKTAGFQYGNEVLAVLADAIGKGALEGGKTFQQFVKEVTPKLQALGWWGRAPMTDPLTGETSMVQLGSLRRLKTIFDVNLRVSYAAGKWEQAQRLKDRRPWLRYVAVMDDRTRHEHREWHGTILGVDHEWWSTHFPPNGWNCRCTVMQLGQADLDRNGWKPNDKPPPGGSTEWENKRTGVTEIVPDGIDPGFVHNPGKGALDAKAVDGLMDAGAKAEPGNAAVTVPKILNTPKPPPVVEPPATPGAPRPALPVSPSVSPASPAPTPGLPPASPGAPLPITAPTRRVLDDLVDAYRQWRAEDPAVSGRDRMIVGMLGADVVDWLLANQISAASAAIEIRRRGIAHIERDLKAQLGIAPPESALAELPRHLAEPDAVLFDRRNGTLLYVFSVAGDARRGKFVVRIDVPVKGRAPDRSRLALRINDVHSAGLVNTETLRDAKSYDVISGKL